jgi:hypothetical protein
MFAELHLLLSFLWRVLMFAIPSCQPWDRVRQNLLRGLQRTNAIQSVVHHIAGIT